MPNLVYRYPMARPPRAAGTTLATFQESMWANPNTTAVTTMRITEALDIPKPPRMYFAESSLLVQTNAMAAIGMPMGRARETTSSHTAASANWNAISGSVILSIHPGVSTESPIAASRNMTISSRMMTDPNSRHTQYMGVGSALAATSARDLTLNMSLDW